MKTKVFQIARTCALAGVSIRGLAAVLIFLAPAAPAQGISLIPTGAVWKYLNPGLDPGTSWRAPNLDDRGWPSGPAQLGFGDGDEATLLDPWLVGGKRL